MKTEYTQNPLEVRTILDEHEKKELWYKIKLGEYEDMLFMGHFYLISEYKDIDKAIKELDPNYWCSDEKTKFDETIDGLTEGYLKELAGFHSGDCTCFAASCWKCIAENLVGVDTLPGLGKHLAYKIEEAFKETKTCLEAIEILKKPYSMEGAVGARS